MEPLTLYSVGPKDTAFLQYIPGNFRAALGMDGTVCIGAVYGSQACGAALAQCGLDGQYTLRYLFVDPKARLCGLGTYLLRGLLGQLRANGARQVSAIYAPSMLEDGRDTLGILERVGFSHPEPFATGFSTRLGDIQPLDLPLLPEMAVYSARDLPDDLRRTYEELMSLGDLPDYADEKELDRPWVELSSFCAEHGSLSGLFLIDRKGEGCHLAGLYVLPGFRGGRTAAALIDRSIRAAKAILPPETEVWTSAVDRNAYSMCDKLLRLGDRALKETEFVSVYRF